MNTEANCKNIDSYILYILETRKGEQNWEGSKRKEFLPPSTAVPMHDRTPDRKELKGNDPTIPM